MEGQNKSRLKGMILTTEMILKKKICICLNLLPDKTYFAYTSKYSNIDLNRNSLLSASRAATSKKNPYFIWDDLSKLQDCYQKLSELAQQMYLISGSTSDATDLKGRNELYQTLVEELAEVLMGNILTLCHFTGLCLPPEFPKDWKPADTASPLGLTQSSESPSTTYRGDSFPHHLK